MSYFKIKDEEDKSDWLTISVNDKAQVEIDVKYWDSYYEENSVCATISKQQVEEMIEYLQSVVTKLNKPLTPTEG